MSSPAATAESVLRTVAGGYVLASGGPCPRRRRAVAPGELDAAVFETQFEAARHALDEGSRRAPPEELRLAALEARVDADLQLGRRAELVGELEALVARHPARKRLAGLLMVALYRAGRRADALDAYQRTPRAWPASWAEARAGAQGAASPDPRSSARAPTTRTRNRPGRHGRVRRASAGAA